MRVRSEVLPDPPDRKPYLRVLAGGREYVLRVPSLHRAALLAQAVTSAELGAFARLIANRSIGAVVQGAPSMLEAIGALIGASWADPLFELETPAPGDWLPEYVRAYGAAIHEELHEAGWPLSWQLAAAGAVLRELVELSRAEAEVQELAGFFGLRTALPRPDERTSTPSGLESPSAEASTP